MNQITVHQHRRADADRSTVDRSDHRLLCVAKRLHELKHRRVHVRRRILHEVFEVVTGGEYVFSPQIKIARTEESSCAAANSIGH